MKMEEGTLKEWTQKMKEWNILYYVLRKNDIACGNLPTSNKMMEDPIGALWNGET